MEAPEKIYMTPSFGEPDNVLLASFSKSHLNYHRDIEYTRTDAFIERAINFLNYKLDDVVNVRVPGTLISEITTHQDFVDEFRKYMEK